MYPKCNIDLNQFENVHSRHQPNVEYRLETDFLITPLYFSGPQRLNRLTVSNFVIHFHSTLPIHMKMTEKYRLTLQALKKFVDEEC